MVWERTDTSRRGGVAPLNLLDWNERNRTFDQIAGFIPGVGGMVMSGADGTAETVPRQWVTAGFFDVLGVKPIAGRTFLPSDDSAARQCRRAERSVLADAFQRGPDAWSAATSGSMASPYTVVGVVPKESQLLGRTSIWALVPIQGAPPEARTAYVLAGRSDA